MSRNDLVLCAAAIVGLAAMIGLVIWLTPADVGPIIKNAHAALAAGEYDNAGALAQRVLQQDPKSAVALLIAGKAAIGKKEFERALEFLERIPDDRSTLAKQARYLSGDVSLFHQNRLSAAERFYRRAIEQDSNYVEAYDKLIHVLTIGGRHREASEQVLHLARLGDLRRFCSKIGVFILGGEGNRLFKIQPTSDKCHEADPSDPVPMLALAVIANNADDHNEALRLLRRAVSIDPELLTAQVWLGRTLLSANQAADFFKWEADLPSSAEEHPDIWSLRGDMARLLNRQQVAARCYFEAVRRDPNLMRANFVLGQLLEQLGENGAAFVKRADLLTQYRDTVGSLSKGGRKFDRAAQLADSLGFVWESETWKLVQRYPMLLNLSDASDVGPSVNWGIDEGRLTRLKDRHNPALSVDLSHFPLPDWPPESATDQSNKKELSLTTVAFQNDATATGLLFQYKNSGEPQKHVLKMQETLGGGIGVFDFDLDGWPDVYLAQGTDWPPESHRGQHIDQLFRNQGNGKFVNVTQASRLIEDGFSQGVTVGDFNGDGFPDVFVGNIGRDRLFENNGDGTFSDVSDRCGLKATQWTTSALLADLDGDRLPDLYTVSYVTGDDVYTRVCETVKLVLEACSPNDFTPAQDQVYRNLGDGRFENMTKSSGIRNTGGNGLGITAINLQGAGVLDVFVANDLTPNHFFRNETKPGSARFTLVEDGLLSGLAFNVLGDREACMGIATGDYDGDGLIDIFVGNFIDESNTLYRQNRMGSFIDVTRGSGLDSPSRGITAFGAEFIDGELDGHLDLVVTNGHINASLGETSYRMPAHYYHNLGNGSFQLGDFSTLGSYFGKRCVGRSLATVDWNRDGAADVVMSPLDSPVTLLTNKTSERGHFVTVQLRGVDSSRDAIGTTVTLEFGDRKLVRQLTAGDGYMVTNQRILRFGLGKVQKVDGMTIRWPSGHRQSFSNIASDSDYIALEGVNRLFESSHKPIAKSE